jgi:hypothetical protein
MRGEGVEVAGIRLEGVARQRPLDTEVIEIGVDPAL